MRGLLYLFAFCVLVGVGAPATSPLAQEGETVALTEAHLEGFIGVMPELRAIAARHDESDDVDTLASNAVSAIAKTQQTMAELDALLKKNGFKDAAEWGKVAASVAAAYNWLSEADDPEQAIENQIAELKAEPSLSEAQKAPLITSLQMQLSLIAEMKPPVENLALVARYRDKIAAVLEE